MTNPRTCRRTARLAVAGLSVWLVVACTGDEAPPEAPPPEQPSPTAESGAPRLVVDDAPMRARVVRVGGELSERERTQVRDNIARVVGSYLDAAYLDLDLGRTNLRGAFAVFTPAAAQQAMRQADVTTSRQLVPELVEVVPTLRRVEAAVFAPPGGPAGATADVTLVAIGARAGGGQVEQTVRGQLFLTATASGWRVFGFELSRSEGAPGSFRRAERQRQADPRARSGGSR